MSRKCSIELLGGTHVVTERCVRIHSITVPSSAKVDAPLTDPLFWMHHAVSVCLQADVTVRTNVAVLDYRWLIKSGLTGSISAHRMPIASLVVQRNVSVACRTMNDFPMVVLRSSA